MRQLLGTCVQLLAKAKRPSLKGPVSVGEMQEEGKFSPVVTDMTPLRDGRLSLSVAQGLK